MVCQHTPVVTASGRNSIVSHDLLPVLGEQLSLQWFGEIISGHFQCGAIINCQVPLLDLICKEEITNVDSAGALTGTFLTVFEEQNGAFVVLVKDVLLNLITLGFHKMFGPQNRTGNIVSTYQFVSGDKLHSPRAAQH